MSWRKNGLIYLVRGVIIAPVCLVLVAYITLYVLYGHQSVVSTRRLYQSDHALLLAESRTILAYHRSVKEPDGEAQRVDIDSGSSEYAKLPATIRRISPVHVMLEGDRLVMTLGVWPRRYAIITADFSEVPDGARQVDEGIWLAHKKF